MGCHQQAVERTGFFELDFQQGHQRLERFGGDQPVGHGAGRENGDCLDSGCRQTGKKAGDFVLCVRQLRRTAEPVSSRFCEKCARMVGPSTNVFDSCNSATMPTRRLTVPTLSRPAARCRARRRLE